MEDDEFYQRLRRLIGRRCSLPDGDWQVIDVLAQDASLVIQCLKGRLSSIQTDAFGNPVRRSPETRLIPLFDGSGHLSPEAEYLLRALQPAD